MSSSSITQRRYASLSQRPLKSKRDRHQATGRREFLAFQLGLESYALPLHRIREILRPPPLTEVPRAPREVLGIVSVRGKVTTVLDLRLKLGLNPTAPTKHTRILLVDGEIEVVGLWVDRVLQVHRLFEHQVEVASSLGGELSEYVIGIGRPKVARGPGNDPADQALREPGQDILILLDPAMLIREGNRGRSR